jgi:hypothetical protein
VASNCHQGVESSLGAELGYPIGIASDPGGKVYVSDRDNQRIQKFADPAPPPPSGPGATPPGPTGLRAHALKKCKKKKGRARAKCKKKAKLLPI